MCNADGSCVQCLALSDCPGENTPCRTKTCFAGACGLNLPPNGMIVANPIAGDCKADFCDGQGNIVSGNYDSDPPDDLNPCTADICTNGVPSNPALPDGEVCGTGKTCQAGVCVYPCSTASDCPPGKDTPCSIRTCNAGACGLYFTPNDGYVVENPIAGDCKASYCDGNGNLFEANDDSDVPADDGDLCTAETCTNGVPSHTPLAVGELCAISSACNSEGVCVSRCAEDSDCPGDNTECVVQTCDAGLCATVYSAEDVQCGFAGMCDARGSCIE